MHIQESSSTFANCSSRRSSCYSAEEISLDLTLFDESWIAKKPGITMGVAANSSSASLDGARTKTRDDQATGPSLRIHDRNSMERERDKRLETGSTVAALGNSTKRSRNSAEEISLELKLFDESWVAKKPKITMGTAAASSAASRNRGMVYNDVISQEINKRLDQEIPGILNLKDRLLAGLRAQFVVRADPWKIKRTITNSNIVVPTRLVVPRTLIQNYVLPLLQTDLINKIEREHGVRVTVLDQDTRSFKFLIFKKWPRGDFVFMGAWNSEFIRRRNLKEGDEIGFYWDRNNSRFNFSVLKRASISQMNHTSGQQTDIPEDIAN